MNRHGSETIQSREDRSFERTFREAEQAAKGGSAGAHERARGIERHCAAMGRHHRTLDSRLRALYGWSSKQAVGRNCVGLLKSRLPIPLEEVERELLRTGHWIGEVEQERHDSSRIAVATHWVTLVEKDPRTPRVIETQTDITARLKMQRELEAANLRLKSMTVELERSNEDLEEFARITSHDLAAPLTSSRWLVDLMQLRHADRLDQDGKAGSRVV